MVPIDDEDAARAARARAILNASKTTPVSVTPKPFTQPMTIAGQTNGVVPSVSQQLSDYVANSAKRIEELTVLENQAGATAVAGGVTPPKLPGESNTAYNTRITEYYKAQPQPVLTDAQKAAGAVVQFVRTGAGGEGEYRIVYPIGTKLDANGNPIVPTQFGNSNNGGGNNNGGSGSNTNVTLVSTETDDYGNVVGVYSDGSTKVLIPSGRQYKSTVDLDAYALLEETFKAYGLESLVPKIKTYMERGLGSNQAALQLKTEPEYVERFRGNEIRRATGLNVLSEGEYLALEDAYSQTLRAYGLQNYFGIDRKVKTAAMADIIGNDIDATEFKDRIDTVVTRVQNADPAIKRTLTMFYNINDTDLIKYFLDPKANLPKLQEKVTAAEIGSAALGQGLATNVSDATALALFGITRGQALEGYAKIGESLPTTKKLGSIYAEEGIDYTQQTAEEEVFKGLASAERKRRQLASREVAIFGGASGVGKTAFGSAISGAI